MARRKTLERIWGLATLILVLSGCSSKGVEATRSVGAALTPVTNLATPTTSVQATPNQNEIRIKKYPGNFTCFKLETAEGIVLITDPYNMDEDVQADIVTVSHNHSDHSDLSRITGTYHLIKTVGTFTEKGIKITGVAGHHNQGEPAITTTNIIYVFDIDGIRLAQFASQGELPTEAMFDQIGKVDILIIQIYGTENQKLSVASANQIAQRVQARIVIPAHTDTNRTDALASLLMGGASDKIITGELTVSQADLAAQSKPRVLVLDVK